MKVLLQTHAKMYYIKNRQNVNKKDLKDGVPILQDLEALSPSHQMVYFIKVEQVEILWRF